MVGERNWENLREGIAEVGDIHILKMSTYKSQAHPWDYMWERPKQFSKDVKNGAKILSTNQIPEHLRGGSAGQTQSSIAKN